DFVQSLLRQHKIGMPCIEIEQLVLVGGKAKEVTLLLYPFDRRALRSDPLPVLVEFGLDFIIESFIAYRVPTQIFREVNVAFLGHFFPNADRRSMMARLSRADEVVI